MSHGTVRKAQPAVRVLEDQGKEGKRREKGNDSFQVRISTHVPRWLNLNKYSRTNTGNGDPMPRVFII